MEACAGDTRPRAAGIKICIRMAELPIASSVVPEFEIGGAPWPLTTTLPVKFRIVVRRKRGR